MNTASVLLLLFSCSVTSDSLQPMDCSMPGCPVHHQLLEFAQIHVHWVGDAIQASPRLLSPSSFAFIFFCEKVKATQSCPTVCDHMDCIPAVSSVYGILQARILEWVAIPFSRDLPNSGIEPGSPALQADSLLSESPGMPTGLPSWSRG